MTIEIDEFRLNQIWEEGFDAAIDYYDGIIDEMHRTLHPDQSLSYKKCFESPCKNL